MLPAMNQHRPLLADASPDAVCALNSLGPNTTEPNPPMLEVLGPAFITTMMNPHSIVVAQQNDVPLLSHNGVQPIDLLPHLHDHFRNGFLRSF